MAVVAARADGIPVGGGEAPAGRLAPADLVRSLGLSGLVRPATSSPPPTPPPSALSDLSSVDKLTQPESARTGVPRLTVARSPAVRMPVGAAAGINAGNVAGALGAPERVLPVVPALRSLLPGGGLRRGTTVSTSGATSLLIALLIAASQAGSWCAIVGMPTLGALAAAEAGVALDRLALVPHPGPDWPTVVAALLDGVDVVVAAPPGPIAASMSSRLAARARQRGSVFVAYGPLPGADVVVTSTGSRWEGLGQGHGRLRRREMTVLVRGRGAAASPRQARFWTPAYQSWNESWNVGAWARRDAQTSTRLEWGPPEAVREPLVALPEPALAS